MVAWLLKSIGIRFAVFDVGQGARGFFPSHAVAFEGDTMGIVDYPVEDGVGDGRFADHVVPLGNGQLGGNQGRFAPVALFEDFEGVSTSGCYTRISRSVAGEPFLALRTAGWRPARFP